MSASKQPQPSPNAATVISLNDVAERYLQVYQRLFDIACFCLASFRKINEEDYDQMAQQSSVMPKIQSRMDFERAKDATQFWMARNTLSEALSTIVPLLEDCRTVCALCDYKMTGKADPALVEKITGPDRQQFLQLPIPEKFAQLKKKYGIESELEDHVQSLLDLTKALVLKDGKLTNEEARNGKLTLKLRMITVMQAPAQSQGGEPILGLTRRMTDHVRDIAVGDKIELSRAEAIGGLITIAGFLATMLQGVQAYAKKVGASE
ncbi:MAG: hypothetical protein PHD76_05465 [Methylacidiphilales bacterium]|nr:hypothetical protein [Candidatus Methylacidiphilales bacterium]